MEGAVTRSRWRERLRKQSVECWYIVVVLELIQYEDTPPVDAPHRARQVGPAARPGEPLGRIFHIPARRPASP